MSIKGAFLARFPKVEKYHGEDPRSVSFKLGPYRNNGR